MFFYIGATLPGDQLVGGTYAVSRFAGSSSGLVFQVNPECGAGGVQCWILTPHFFVINI